MVEQHRPDPRWSRSAARFALGIIVTFALVAGCARGYAGDNVMPSPSTGPVHTPQGWAFWDEMASAFSIVTPPATLFDRPGVIYSWWFDSTYVTGWERAPGLDLTPLDCAGIGRWAAQFERYGFEDGVTFALSRYGACRAWRRHP